MKQTQIKRNRLWMSIVILVIAGTAYADRSVEVLTSGWRFAKGPQRSIAIQPVFDDSAWQTVRVPHDWAISGPFDESANGYAGKLPWQGQGWYRKTFTLKADDAGKRVYLDFDGVMAFPKVFVNGQLAGQWDYAYSPFRVDATAYVKFGQTNTMAVQADMDKWGTRWYPGGGIYRKVTLTVCDPVHIAHWGQVITTPTNDPGRVPNTVRVRTTLENHGAETQYVTLKVALFDPDGRQVAVDERIQSIDANVPCDVDQAFFLSSPELWDTTSPNLYTAETTVSQNGQVVDSLTTSFGVRTFEFKADDGFHLNGKRVQLYGVNLHHDQGPLGAAFHVRAMERQLEIMKDMGVNALRTSHNPPAAEVLDLCDRMGIVVWDEVFDKWDRTAGRQRGEPPLKEFSQRQITNVVKRDRNHACVVVWSIGNEIGAGGEGVTPERVAYMRDFVREHDTSRPVGMGCHIPNMSDQPNFDALDLTGWNYGRRYERFRKKYPNTPIIYSESASALSTRGFYDLTLPDRKNAYSANFQVSSYDLCAANWSDIPDKEFKLMEDDRFVAGEFVWTGFDYLGEPTPFSREAKSSYFGIVDLCGIPKDRFFLYRSHWRPEVSTVHILPHWNWPDQVGKTVPVFVYTNGDSAELFLNGKSLGKRTKGQVPKRPEKDYYDVTYAYRLRWNDVIYDPGELKAVAYKDGQVIGEAAIRTAGDPARLKLTPDRTELKADGDDLSYITVEVLDTQGNPNAVADNLIQFEVTGPAEIVGVGNGNPLSVEPFQADYRKLFYGKAMLIIRSLAGQTGQVQVKAQSEGIESAAVQLAVQSPSVRYP
jgi:beta-galactosidase